MTNLYIDTWDKRIINEYFSSGKEHVLSKFNITEELLEGKLQLYYKPRDIIKRELAKRLSTHFDNYTGDPQESRAEMLAEDWANGINNELWREL